MVSRYVYGVVWALVLGASAGSSPNYPNARGYADYTSTAISTTTVGAGGSQPVQTCAISTPTSSKTAEPQATVVSYDLTWGCKAGTNCNPPKADGCNVYSNPPAADYVCAPEYCVEIPEFVAVTWPADETGYFPLTEGYFNLNPEAFGLSFDIFSENLVVEVVDGTTTTITTGTWVSQTDLAAFTISGATSTSSAESSTSTNFWSRGKRIHKYKMASVKSRQSLDESTIPSTCYAPCGNAYSIAQQSGKVDSLCAQDSNFRQAYNNCNECIDTYDQSTNKTSDKTYLDSQFATFIDFCDSTNATTPTTGTAPGADMTSTPGAVTSGQQTGTSVTDIIITSSTSATSSSASSTTVSSTSLSSGSASTTSSSSTVSTSSVNETSSSSISSSSSVSVSVSSTSTSNEATSFSSSIESTSSSSSASPSASSSSASISSSGSSLTESSASSATSSSKTVVSTSASPTTGSSASSVSTIQGSSASSRPSPSSTPSATGSSFSSSTFSSAPTGFQSTGAPFPTIPTNATSAVSSSTTGFVTAGAARLHGMSGTSLSGIVMPLLAWVFFV